MKETFFTPPPPLFSQTFLSPSPAAAHGIHLRTTQALPFGPPNCSFPLSLLWGYGTGHGAARGEEKKVWGERCDNFGFPEEQHISRNENIRKRIKKSVLCANKLC